MSWRNVELKPYRPATPWRKIAVGTWDHPGDPQAYTTLEVDAAPMLERIRRSAEIKITPTMVVAKGLALGIAAYPRANAILRFGRIYHREGIHIQLPIAIERSGEDLSSILVRDCDRKSLEEIAAEVRARVEALHAAAREEMAQAKGIVDWIPGAASFHVMKLLGFVLYTLNVRLPFLGLPEDAFGSATVTSLGSVGLANGLGPLDPYSRCPLFVTVGRISDQPMAIGGEVVVRPALSVGITFDHRLVDGIGIARIVDTLARYLADPR